MDKPIYGWKILKLLRSGNDIRLISPVMRTEWPTKSYFIAEDFPHDYKPGDEIRGGPGIHAVGPDNFNEISVYAEASAVLVLLQFAGKVYIGQDEEGKSTILAEKARPVLIINDNEEINRKLSESYGVSAITFKEIFDINSASDVIQLNSKYDAVLTNVKYYSNIDSIMPFGSDVFPDPKDLFVAAKKISMASGDEYASDIIVRPKTPDLPSGRVNFLSNDINLEFDSQNVYLSQAVGMALLRFYDIFNIGNVKIIDHNAYLIPTSAPSVLEDFEDNSLMNPLVIEYNDYVLVVLSSNLVVTLLLKLSDHNMIEDFKEMTDPPNAEDLRIIREFSGTFRFDFSDVDYLDVEYEYMQSGEYSVEHLEDLQNDELEYSRWDVEIDVDMDSDYEYETSKFGVSYPIKEIIYTYEPLELIFTPGDFVNILSEMISQNLPKVQIHYYIKKMGDIVFDEDYNTNRNPWQPYMGDVQMLIELARNQLGKKIDPFVEVIEREFSP